MCSFLLQPFREALIIIFLAYWAYISHIMQVIGKRIEIVSVELLPLIWIELLQLKYHLSPLWEGSCPCW